MPTSSRVAVVNRLIDDLPCADRERFLAQCTTEQLAFGEILCDAGKPAAHVHFPLTGYIGLMGSIKGRNSLEMGIIGNEGMLGATLALGVDAPPLRGVVQGSGTALRMTAVRFRRQLKLSPQLRRTLDGYLYVRIEQLALTAACNCFHEVIERLARFLLMAHDRSHGDSLHLTHVFLAQMLGVRREGVTEAAGKLQRLGVISYHRGYIRVTSTRGLKAASCGCYAALTRAYDRRFPVVTAIRGKALNQHRLT